MNSVKGVPFVGRRKLTMHGCQDYPNRNAWPCHGNLICARILEGTPCMLGRPRGWRRRLEHLQGGRAGDDQENVLIGVPATTALVTNQMRMRSHWLSMTELNLPAVCAALWFCRLILGPRWLSMPKPNLSSMSPLRTYTPECLQSHNTNRMGSCTGLTRQTIAFYPLGSDKFAEM